MYQFIRPPSAADRGKRHKLKMFKYGTNGVLVIYLRPLRIDKSLKAVNFILISNRMIKAESMISK